MHFTRLNNNNHKISIRKLKLKLRLNGQYLACGNRYDTVFLKSTGATMLHAKGKRTFGKLKNLSVWRKNRWIVVDTKKPHTWQIYGFGILASFALEKIHGWIDKIYNLSSSIYCESFVKYMIKNSVKITGEVSYRILITDQLRSGIVV